MGGKNHQPCNRPSAGYLIESTKLSKALSSALARLELANVDLEDVLLGELIDKKPHTLGHMIANLEISAFDLREALKNLDALERKMHEFDFQDLPTLKTVDLDMVGKSLSQRRVVDKAAWEVVKTTMEQGGFRNMLKYFRHGVYRILSQTIELRSAMIALEPIAQGTGLADVLEKNQPGNIKLIFGALYTSWCSFNQVFLASSLLSTELWYQATDCPSMVENASIKNTYQNKVVPIAAVAF